MGDTMSDSWVDSDFGNIAQYAEVVVFFAVFRQQTTGFFHGVGCLDSTLPVFTDTAHGLCIGREHGQSAQIVQHVFSSDGFRTNTAFSESCVRRNSCVQVVAHANHVEQLSLGVYTERQAGVGRRWQHVHEASCTDNVRSVTTATAFSVEGVDGTAFECGNRVFHIATFVQGVGVDGYLHVILVSYAQASADSVRSCTPVFVNFEGANASFNLFNQSSFTSALTSSSLTFTHQTDVQRHSFHGAQHLLNVPYARCYCSSVGAVCRTEATSNQSSTATSQCSVVDLWANQVHVGVDTASGNDGRAAVDSVSSWAANQTRCYTFHGVGVTSFTDTNDFASFNTDVSFNNALDRVDDGCVCQHQVQAARAAGSGVVKAHAVTQCFTTAEHGLITIASAQVFFNFNKKVGVAQANFVTNCGAIQAHICFTRYLSHYAFLSNIRNVSLETH